MAFIRSRDISGGSGKGEPAGQFLLAMYGEYLSESSLAGVGIVGFL